MGLRKRVAGWALVPAAVALVAPQTAAIAMTVQPVIVDLSASGRQMSAVVTVQNTFQTPLPVELRVQEAVFVKDGLQGNGKDAGEDILIFPPQALIAAGRTQSFRLQYVGDPALAKSRHFYVTVAQLPVKLPEGQSAVQILYNFQVIVSVGVPGARPAITVGSTEIVTQPDGKPHAVLLLENAAATYGYLSLGSLRVVQKDAAGKEIYRKTLTPAEIQQQIGFGLVGAGEKRRLVTPLILPSAGGTLEAEFTPSRG